MPKKEQDGNPADTVGRQMRKFLLRKCEGPSRSRFPEREAGLDTCSYFELK